MEKIIVKITTDDCKNHLVTHLQSQCMATTESEWKRGAKRKEGEDTVREFTHKTLGIYVVAERDGQIVSAEKMDADRTQSVLATALVARMISNEETQFDAIAKALANKSIEPKAIAGKFIFGLAGPADASMAGEGMMIAIITPRTYWDKTECWYDQELDLAPLLPPGSEDLNGCGTWCIPFANADALAFRDFLQNAGFVWDAKFQASVNDIGSDAADADGWDPSVLDESDAAKTPKIKP